LSCWGGGREIKEKRSSRNKGNVKSERNAREVKKGGGEEVGREMMVREKKEKPISFRSRARSHGKKGLCPYDRLCLIAESGEEEKKRVKKRKKEGGNRGLPASCLKEDGYN